MGKRLTHEIGQHAGPLRLIAEQRAEVVPGACVLGILAEDFWQAVRNPRRESFGQLAEERRVRAVGVPEQGMILRLFPDFDPGGADDILV